MSLMVASAVGVVSGMSNRKVIALFPCSFLSRICYFQSGFQ